MITGSIEKFTLGSKVHLIIGDGIEVSGVITRISYEDNGIIRYSFKSDGPFSVEVHGVRSEHFI